METSSQPFQTIKAKRDLYYTNDYEWIEFQGSVAYIGLCPFKLAGIKEIDKIEFSKENNTKKCGEIIGSIIYEDCKIDVHMPVSGCIVFFNAAILAGDKNIVLHEPETRGYIALIFPSFPYDRGGLVTS
jgi:glycine cleavage system H protein